MTNTTYNKTKMARPRSTHFQAVQTVVKKYRVDARNGRIYNRNGEEIGSWTYEPRITVHLQDKKFNARISKIIGFVKFGPEALRRGVSVVHVNGDKFDNRSSNLKLRYNKQALRNLRRLLAS